MNNRKYMRHFIILENEDSGFESNDKTTPKGYAKIEVRNGKGVLNVYVQDLKYFEDGKYIYRSYLIGTKDKDTCVDTGVIMIDEKGKGELKSKINPENIEGSGRPIEDYNTVAIVAEPVDNTNANNIYGPLVGYIEKDKGDWRSALENNRMSDVDEAEDIDDEDKEKYEKIMNAIKQGAEDLFIGAKDEEEDLGSEPEDIEDIEENNENIAEENEEIEVIESTPNNNENNDMIGAKEEKYEENEYYEESEEEEENEGYEENEEYEEEKESIEEKEPKKEEEKDKKEEKPEEDIIMEKEAKESVLDKNNEEEYKKQSGYQRPKPSNKTMKNSNQHNQYTTYKKYHEMVYKHIKDTLAKYEEIEPFENNLSNCKWWKMDYDSQAMYQGFLPYFGYILNTYYYNPYIYYMGSCNDAMYKYGHYIFGICYNDESQPKHYVYGVPGRYLYKEQPFRGMTGFVYWHPLEDKDPEKGDYGYWLLFVDVVTGNILFPEKPTIPPMY